MGGGLQVELAALAGWRVRRVSSSANDMLKLRKLRPKKRLYTGVAPHGEKKKSNEPTPPQSRNAQMPNMDNEEGVYVTHTIRCLFRNRHATLPSPLNFDIQSQGSSSTSPAWKWTRHASYPSRVPQWLRAGDPCLSTRRVLFRTRPRLASCQTCRRPRGSSFTRLTVLGHPPKVFNWFRCIARTLIAIAILIKRLPQPRFS